MSSAYYNMTDSTGASGFLPTVVFDGSSNGTFSSDHRIARLNALGITGFYQADFANNITTINSSAFYTDTKIVVATINKVTSIGGSSFSQCPNLRSITLDCGVDASGKYLLTTIGAYAFNGCSSLRSIYIPDTVKIIPVGLCYGCPSLEIAVMGYGSNRTDTSYNRDSTIGGTAFASCQRLSVIVIPETVSSIDYNAFQNDTSLSRVYILGRPTIVASAFTNTMDNSGAIYYFDNSASYTDLNLSTAQTLFPTNATKRPYREIDISAGGSATLTSAHVNSALTSFAPSSYWKGKIMAPVTSLADNCFRGQTAGTDGIGTTNYSNMIGVSFPNNLTSIGYAAFCNSDGTTPVACNVGGFYIPNTVSTFGVSGVSGDTFWLTNASGQALSTTNQFVFHSGRTTPITTLPPRMFQYSSAMAMVIPTFTNIGASCFQFARYIQYFNFFQKNAYTTLTKLDGATTDSGTNAFSNCFNARTSNTQYLYIPKAVATISTSAFMNSTNPLYITVYSSDTDGAAGTGLCATVNDLSSTYFTGTVAPTFFLINNYYDANGLILGTFVPTTGTYHVLFSSGVKTINNRFASSMNLITVTIENNVTDISLSAFSNCTRLVNVLFSPTSNLTYIGSGAFSGDTSLNSFFVPNSLRFISRNMFSGCTNLASVTYGDNPSIKYIDASGFYNATTKLTSIFIPSSVVSIGSQAFITSTTQNNLAAVTFGVGSRLKSIGGGCFGHATSTYAARYLTNLALPIGVRCIGTGLSGGFVSDATTSNVFRNAFTLTHSDNLILPSSLESLSNGFLFTDSSNVDISNVYLPKSITNVAGPRRHCGYTTSGLGGNEFSSTTIGSRAGSLLYLPSELSTYTPSSLPGLNRARSYYRTVSYTDNPVVSLNLSGTVANTTNPTTTTQIHADIQEGVTVIGGGTTSIDMSGSVDGSLNLISVNIPSTVTNISANAFSGCSALTYVTFSEGSRLTTIDNSAFLECTNIQDIKLPDTVTTIGANAFSGCNILASIYIPYNVTSIGSGAFKHDINKMKQGSICDLSQLGADIDGENAGDQSGYSVSMNGAGNIVAIGAILNVGNPVVTARGQVRVYMYDPAKTTSVVDQSSNNFGPIGWRRLGQDIDGEAINVRSGWCVSLSRDGYTVAISTNGTVSTVKPRTSVYQYDASKNTLVTDQSSNDFGPIGWRRLGQNIFPPGINAGDTGSSVSLISDASNGTIVAMGTFYSESVGVYKYDANKLTDVSVTTSPDFGPIGWRRLGANITGSAGDKTGSSVSLSIDGTIIAIGAPDSDGSTGYQTRGGRVRVYKYDASKNTANANGPIGWNQLGGNMDGEASNNFFGYSVSISSDGTIVAIGGTQNAGGGVIRGHVRVFKYDLAKSTLVTDQSSNNFGPIGWRRLGQDIDGEADYDTSSYSISLNATGNIVAISSPNNRAARGHVRVYKYDSDKTNSEVNQSSNDFGPIGWRRLGQDIDGEFADDYSGWSISLNNAGDTIAIGAYTNDGTPVLTDRGHVRVYRINRVIPVRLHQRLYQDFFGSTLLTNWGISTATLTVIPEFQLTNTRNPSKLTISQINNMYIRYRQSQLSSFTSISVSASSGGILTAANVTTALSSSSGFVRLDISTNVTSIAASACTANTRIYSISIPRTVVTIGDNAFNGCTNLNYLSFHPDSVCTTIGSYAFGNNSAVSNNIFDIALPDMLTTIGLGAFQQSVNLTSVCIPKSVTSLGSDAFTNCAKLTSVALPASLAANATSTYFNANGSSTAGITFSSYSVTSAIQHFKLSDYSMPNGIVQNVVDSKVTYIDHLAYVYYPDITLYTVTTQKNTQTAGQYSYTVNNVRTSIMPATFWLNGASVISNAMFPIYRSVPDLNVFSGSSNTTDTLDKQDDFYILMPGYSICIHNNLYDEENIFTDTPTYRYYDNEFGTVPLNITLNGFANTTSSILILFNGRILSKYFNS